MRDACRSAIRSGIFLGAILFVLVHSASMANAPGQIKIDFGAGDVLPELNVGNIANIYDPIVLTPDGTKAVVAIVGENDVAVIDLASASVSKIDFGVGDVIADNPFTIKTTNSRAVVGIGGANDVAIINLSSLAVTKIDFGAGDVLPELNVGNIANIYDPIVLTPDGTKAVVAIVGENDVAVIDLASASVAKIDCGVGDVIADNPFTIKTTNSRAVVGIGGASDVAIINLSSLAVTKIDFGAGDVLPELNVGNIANIYDPVVLTPDGTKAVVAIVGENDVAVIDLASASVAKIDCGVGDVIADNPFTIKTTNSRAVVGIGGASDVAIINLSSLAVTKIDFGAGDVLPELNVGNIVNIYDPIVLTPDGTKAVVAIAGENDVAVIDLANASVSKIDFGVGDVIADNPFTIKTTNSRVVVGIGGANDVAIINLSSLAVTKIDFGAGDVLPELNVGNIANIYDPIVLTPDGTKAVVAIVGENDVAVIDLASASVAKIDFGVGDVIADNPFTIKTTNSRAVVGIGGANDVAIIATAATVPALSQLGLTVLALSVLTAGTIVLRRREALNQWAGDHVANWRRDR